MTHGLESQTDAQLMASLALGDVNCLGVLVDRHQQMARRLAYRWLRSWPDADDVAQDAFIRVMNAASKYQPTASFTTWLYRIVVNLCMDHRRKRARRDVLPLTGATDVVQSADDAVTMLASREQTDHVRLAVDSLPPRQRMAVILLRFEGLTYSQIAEAMEISESAVDSLLSRAWVALREKLADVPH